MSNDYKLAGEAHSYMGNSVNKAEQIKAPKNGKEIQYLLNNAYKIMGNPVFMFDMDYRLLGCSENVVTDDPLWNEIIINGCFGSEIKKMFRDECFLDDISNAKTVALLTSEKLKYDRLVGKIFNSDNTLVAFMHAAACCKPFGANDPIAFEAIREALSKEISKSKFFQSYGTSLQETLIRKLIDGKIDDRRTYTAQVADIDSGLKAYLYIAVADITKCDPKHNKLAYFRNLFKRKQPEFKYFIYNNYIIFIMSTEQARFDVKKELNKLYKILMRKGIFLGISSSFDNLYELQKYYYEAVGALNDGLKNNGNQISLFDEIKD